MKTFIKVTEIWTLNKQGSALELKEGLYGDYKELKKISQKKTFAYQQGLPGTVWSAGFPIVISDLDSSYFERSKLARKAGLTCAIGMPILSGEFLMAVIVFLCGSQEENMGAIEVWSNDIDRMNELGVIDGYYGSLEYFEFVSRRTKFTKGMGLPGLVWENELPVFMPSLKNTPAFIRAEDAKNAELSKGIGIPVCTQNGRIYIMTFLSSEKTPIAKRLQIWLPDSTHKQLICQSAYGQENNDLASIFEVKGIAKGSAGAVGQAWLTGMPVIGESSIRSPASDPAAISSLLAMPVIDQGRLKAVVTFLF